MDNVSYDLGTSEIKVEAIQRKKALDASFFKKGVLIALLSGVIYGLYTAFLNLAMSKGVWADWLSEDSLLPAATLVFLIPTIGAGINDVCSAIWGLINAGRKGKLKDLARTIPTKPGVIMIGAALIGGPIAGAAYIIAIQMGGSIVIPIAALNTAVGAILGRILFNQELNKRMVLGIFICVSAGFLIGSSSISGAGQEGVVTGMLIALIAAFGWGLEGCVAGFGTSMIDSEIGINIRQLTSALGNLFILLPMFTIILGQNLNQTVGFVIEALTDFASMKFFIISGFFTLFTFSFWYKGNSMCGAALGMACNGTYSFWGPLFCWLILGVLDGQPGWEVPPVAWIGALLMALGILIISVNPLDLIRKEDPNEITT